jgi:exopolysaccharide production protein ExoY
MLIFNQARGASLTSRWQTQGVVQPTDRDRVQPLAALIGRKTLADYLHGPEPRCLLTCSDQQLWLASVSGVYARFGKRTLDIVLCLMAATVVLPVLLLVLLIVSLDGHAPIYAHRRVGRGGRLFNCLKVRTMVPNADERLRRLLASDPQAAREWKRHHKLLRDPRVTWFGRVLRATSLDELPQLWNVMRGDMSLVGPRPVTQAEIQRYADAGPLVLSVRPGLTGAWQVSGRNRVDYHERVRMDVNYVTSISLRNDLKIILGTFPAVLAGTGA